MKFKFLKNVNCTHSKLMETYVNVYDLNGQVFMSRHGFQLILYGRHPAKGATLYGLEGACAICIFVEDVGRNVYR